jgi:diguanylate cyclase (GGDEF)-like protein
MNRIWELYENMNEAVYVSDVETHELVYANRKLRKLLGVQSMEQLKGKKCHKLLQDSARPCTICNNSKLDVGEFEEWSYYNPKMKKTFMLKDTVVEVEGRRYRMELAIDASAQEQQQETIDSYINNEAILNKALKLALSAVKPTDSIRILLEYVGKALSCDRIYIFEKKKSGLYDNTFEWCAGNVVPQIDNLKNLTPEDLKTWLDAFQDKENVAIKNLDDIKEADPAMYDILYPQDIHSIVVSPLHKGDEIAGFFGVDNPPEHAMENISGMFMIMGRFIESLLRRSDLYKRLEKLSYYDKLTKFGNRYKMEEFTANIKPEDSIGVVNCDVMGLKKVNDTQGHHAGDALLVRCCECLASVFSDGARFRMGGDEFLVLCVGISEEELDARVKHLRTVMREQSAMMAIGQVYSSACGTNLNQLLIEADARMYEDKRANGGGRGR